MRDAAVLLEHVNAIDGWLADEEAMLLYDLAAACTAGCIVEIGSWQGKSTVCLAFGAADGHRPRVYAIDPHQGSPEVFGTGRDTFAGFQANLERAGVSDLVTPLVQEAATAAATFDQPIGLLFIDGDHSAAAVWKDFELWGAKVINGGIIALHDTHDARYPGIDDVVINGMLRTRRFRNVRFVNSITCGQKTTRAGALDALRNRIGLLVRYPERYRGILKWDYYPRVVRRLGFRVLRALSR